jgi:hypothetical protein
MPPPVTQVFGLHGSKYMTEDTHRQLNAGSLRAGQSGGYRQMAKFAICARRREMFVSKSDSSTLRFE